MARKAVRVLYKGDPEIERLQAAGATIFQPMSVEELRSCETTLHDFFANAESDDVVAVVVVESLEQVAERAILEAAKGMRDNIRNT
jgi:hypothetical protein